MALASRSFSDQLLLCLPLLATVLLLLLRAGPALSGLAYLPEFLCISLFFWRVYYPGAMPYLLVFGLGLLQDLITGAPVGSYTLSSMVIALLLTRAAPRILRQPFRIVWVSACAFCALFLLLTALANMVALNVIVWPELLKSFIAAAVSYPLWHSLFGLLLRVMPAGLSR